VIRFRTLCYVDDQQGRDVEMLLPLIYYAEKYLRCEVRFVFIWDIFAIYTEKPDLIILANTVGSKWHFEIARYAHEQNITVFALISEGNFRTDGTFDYWGYNTDRKFFQEFVCHWSERTRNFLKQKLPDMAKQMVLTGGTGFDRYRIYRFMSKESFLLKKGLTNFNKIIGYAGWTFGKLYSETGRQELAFFFSGKQESWMEWTKKQMAEVEGILRQLIENNRDVLFILKRHPNETHPHITKESPNEMSGLTNYPNVLYIKNDENIHDLISVSDIWMGFQTTTSMEAWLLGKETILINPDTDFPRDISFRGSLIADSYSSVQSYINEFYGNGKINDFYTSDKVNIRKTMIRETIGYEDGLNHLRAAFYLKESLKRSEGRDKKPVFRLTYFIRSLEQHVGIKFFNRSLFLLLPKFRKTVWIFDRCKLGNISVLKSRYYPFLEHFYAVHNLESRESHEKFWQKEHIIREL
jgi:surface carbohydrate biosynthesis protein